MDMLDSPAPNSLGPPPTETKGPGRPPISPAQRALSDEKYAQMLEMVEELPAEAKEYRFAIYEALRSGRQKASFTPVETILFSEYKQQGLKNRETLSAYLFDKFGPGYYIVEAQDQHNNRLDRVPQWSVMAGTEDDMDDDQFDDGPRPRRRSRPGWSRNHDEYDEDPRDARANAADLMSTVSRSNAAGIAQVANSNKDIMSVMLLTQQSAAEARAAEDRRRDEARESERKRDEDRAERRREDAERERRDRDERDERNRREEREIAAREDARRREELQLTMANQSKRMEVLLGGVTAFMPILAKMFEKKEDTTLPILLQSLNKPPDPMMAILLKGIMDKANDDSATKNMLTQFGEMSKITATMTAEQMKSMMGLSQSMNETVMKKAMEMMMASPEGKTPEGKSMIEQVMTALSSASDIVKSLVPPTPPAPPQQRLIQHTAAPTALPQPQQAQPAAQAPAQAPAPSGRPVVNPKRPDGSDKSAREIAWESMTPEEQAQMQASAPTGVPAVLGCLKALETHQYTNQAEYQNLIQYLVQQMPLPLRVAVLDGDELTVMAISTPHAQADPELWSWLMTPAVAAAPAANGVPAIEAKLATLDWVRQFVAQLPPSIEAIHGPAAKQREALVAEKAAAAPATAPPTPTPPVTPTEAPPAPTVPSTPPDPAAPAAPGPSAQDPIPGPGSVVPDAGKDVPGMIEPRQTEVEPATSHLGPDDP
jgi:hypothetical protein